MMIPDYLGSKVKADVMRPCFNYFSRVHTWTDRVKADLVGSDNSCTFQSFQTLPGKLFLTFAIQFNTIIHLAPNIPSDGSLLFCFVFVHRLRQKHLYKTSRCGIFFFFFKEWQFLFIFMNPSIRLFNYMGING